MPTQGLWKGPSAAFRGLSPDFGQTLSGKPENYENQERARKEGKLMPNYYVTLYKLTDQGIKEIKSAPQRIEANKKALDAVGGKMIGLYATMGEYDYVSVV